MNRAIVQCELLTCGTQVLLSLKRGSAFTAKISDIYKGENEKSLVETFDEPFLFPVEIKGKGEYFFHGHGQNAIKHGEAFRAIINGKNIKTE